MRVTPSRLALFVAAATAVGGAAVGAGASSTTQPLAVQRVLSTAAVHNDLSAPLRDMLVTWPAKPGFSHEPPEAVPANRPRVQDGALQASATASSSLQVLGSFHGISDGEHGYNVLMQGGLPPDTVGAIGTTQYVQMVNLAMAVFSKKGALLLGPVPANQVWKGFGGDCEKHDDGDPVVLFDHLANRWVVTQFAISTGPNSNGSLECVAISKTADATGSWYRYAFDYTKYGSINDYPKLGIMPTAYYMTYNFPGSLVCAMSRAAMLVGKPATQQCALAPGGLASLMPADIDGRVLPPKGEPEFLLEKAPNALNIFTFTVDWKHPDRSHLDKLSPLPVAPYNDACLVSAAPEIPNGYGCIPQPGSGPSGYVSALESTGDRLMFRLAYRRFADGHESMVVNHAANGGFPTGAVSGVRWYELSRRVGAWSIARQAKQQGTYAPDLNSRWEGSVAMDRAGDIAMGYSLSGPATFPSIALTGRLYGDPPGEMRAETVAVSGMGSQIIPRWGDYSAMTLDPTDDCTFWFTSEYLKVPGTFNWSTAIVSARFPSCHG
ncbi:MAG: hypothetical protein JO079_02410 [Frankiaceae bacterium]|nr:hypothetical protein [Frankiaceae bacterium]MBV9368480.1 hypothetical protein [Frankiales bacterium]